MIDLTTDEGLRDMDALLPEAIEPCDDSWENVLTRAVERGVAFLDAIDPTWRDLIDWDDLDIDSPCRCIRGQLGTDERLRVAIDLWGGATGTPEYPSDLGMDAYGGQFDGEDVRLRLDGQRQMLNRFWLRTIEHEGWDRG